MSDAKNKTIALNVCLKPSEPSAHPRATNYTNSAWPRGSPMSISDSLNPRYSPPSPGPLKMARSRQKDWTVPSSPAWRWAWMCWPGCISRYNLY